MIMFTIQKQFRDILFNNIFNIEVSCFLNTILVVRINNILKLVEF